MGAQRGAADAPIGSPKVKRGSPCYPGWRCAARVFFFRRFFSTSLLKMQSSRGSARLVSEEGTCVRSVPPPAATNGVRRCAGNIQDMWSNVQTFLCSISSRDVKLSAVLTCKRLISGSVRGAEAEGSIVRPA